MKLSAVIIIALVGIFLVGITEPQVVPDEFTAVFPSDPAPSGIHNSCSQELIFLKLCITWTDPFDVDAPRAVQLRRPYSRYTVLVSSSSGVTVVFPNIVEQVLTLDSTTAPTLIVPGNTVTISAAGQQINDTTKLSQYSINPLVIIIPSFNVSANDTSPSSSDGDTSNGIYGVKITWRNGTATARWALGSRPLVRAFINLYCAKLDGTKPKKNAKFGKTVPTGQTMTSISVPFAFTGYNCKAVLTAFYSNLAFKNFKRYFNTTL